MYGETFYGRHHGTTPAAVKSNIKSEAAVKALKMGKSAGMDTIPAELGQAGGEAMIDILTAICNKIWKTGEWPTTWTPSLVITHPKKGNLHCARTTEPSALSAILVRSC